MKTKIVLAIFLLFNSFIASADEIKNIKNLYQNINRSIKEQKSQKILVYLELLEQAKDGIWKRVKNSDSRQQFSKSIIKNELFIQNKKIIKIVQKTESKSGDWEDIHEFYFYENGKTAFIFQKLITFQAYDPTQEKSFSQGPYVLEKRQYFNLKGEEIKLLLQAYASSTKKEIPVKSVHQIDLEEYKSIQELPFLKLLVSDVMYESTKEE